MVKRAFWWSIIVGAVVFALHGCGGGGGGGGSGAQLPPRSRQVTRSATQAIEPIKRGLQGFSSLSALQSIGGRSHKSRTSKLTRQGGCPDITFNQVDDDTFIITLDYTSGCRDQDGDLISGSLTITVDNVVRDGDDNPTHCDITFAYGDNYRENDVPIRGSFVMSFRDLVYDANGNPVQGTIDCTLDYTENDESFGGSLTVTLSNPVYDANGELVGGTFDIGMDLAFHSGSCSEQFVFNGTLNLSGESISLSGEGHYHNSSMAEGEHTQITMSNLHFTDSCDFPVSGTLQVTDGSTVVDINFSSTCGRATASIDGETPQQVDLRGLAELPPCGQ